MLSWDFVKLFYILHKNYTNKWYIFFFSKSATTKRFRNTNWKAVVSLPHQWFEQPCCWQAQMFITFRVIMFTSSVTEVSQTPTWFAHTRCLDSLRLVFLRLYPSNITHCISLTFRYPVLSVLLVVCIIYVTSNVEQVLEEITFQSDTYFPSKSVCCISFFCFSCPLCEQCWHVVKLF